MLDSIGKFIRRQFPGNYPVTVEPFPARPNGLKVSLHPELAPKEAARVVERLLSAKKIRNEAAWSIHVRDFLTLTDDLIKKNMDLDMHVGRDAYVLINDHRADLAMYERLKKGDFDRDKLPIKFVTKPYDYQYAAIAYLLAAGSGILMDELGLGKTKCALDATSGESEVLIVCEAYLIDMTWLGEIRRHLGEEPVVIAGPAEKRVLLYDAPGRIKIVSYDTLKRDMLQKLITVKGQCWNGEKGPELSKGCKEKITVKDQVSPAVVCPNCGRKAKPLGCFMYNQLDKGKQMFRPGPAFGRVWPAVIADEFHEIRGKKSHRARAIHEIKAERRIPLGGTMVVNDARDLWGPLRWVDPDAIGSKSQFEGRYAFYQTNEKGYREFKETYRKAELIALLQEYSIRRTKVDHLKGLPEKIYKHSLVPMHPEQRKMYVAFKKEIWEEIRKSNLERPETIELAITKMLRLSQIASTTATVCDQDYSGKLDILDDLLEENIDDCKHIIWTRFVPTIEAAAKRFIRFSPVTLYGATKDKLAAQERFNNDPKCRLGIFNYLAVGKGTTFNGGPEPENQCRAAHFIDLSWSPVQSWLQPQDRNHRATSIAASIYIHRMFHGGQDSIDELLWETISEKMGNADEFLGPSEIKPTAERIRNFFS